MLSLTAQLVAAASQEAHLVVRLQEAEASLEEGAWALAAANAQLEEASEMAAQAEAKRRGAADCLDARMQEAAGLRAQLLAQTAACSQVGGIFLAGF